MLSDKSDRPFSNVTGFGLDGKNSIPLRICVHHVYTELTVHSSLCPVVVMTHFPNDT